MASPGLQLAERKAKAISMLSRSSAPRILLQDLYAIGESSSDSEEEIRGTTQARSCAKGSKEASLASDSAGASQPAALRSTGARNVEPVLRVLRVNKDEVASRAAQGARRGSRSPRLRDRDAQAAPAVRREVRNASVSRRLHEDATNIDRSRKRKRRAPSTMAAEPEGDRDRHRRRHHGEGGDRRRRCDRSRSHGRRHRERGAPDGMGMPPPHLPPPAGWLGPQSQRPGSRGPPPVDWRGPSNPPRDAWHTAPHHGGPPPGHHGYPPQPGGWYGAPPGMYGQSPSRPMPGQWPGYLLAQPEQQPHWGPPPGMVPSREPPSEWLGPEMKASTDPRNPADQAGDSQGKKAVDDRAEMGDKAAAQRGDGPPAEMALGGGLAGLSGFADRGMRDLANALDGAILEDESSKAAQRKPETPAERLRGVRIVTNALSQATLERLRAAGIPENGRSESSAETNEYGATSAEAAGAAGGVVSVRSRCISLGLDGTMQRARIPPPMPTPAKLPVCTSDIKYTGLWERFRQICGTPIPADAPTVPCEIRKSRVGTVMLLSLPAQLR